MKSMKNILPFLVIVLFIINGINGYKILGVFPTMAKSHYISGDSLMRGLAAAGHEVTVISAFEQPKPLKNFRNIKADTIVQIMKDRLGNMLDVSKKSIIQSTFERFDFAILLSNSTLQHERVQQLLNDPNEKFDLIILEIFLNEAMLGLGTHFNAPVIGFSPFGASKWTNDLVGTPSPLSFVPHPFLSFSDKMNFAQRVGNTIMTTFENILFETVYMPMQIELYNKVFPDPNKPTLDNLRKNVPLVLLNNHFTMNFPRPYATNMIEIGGTHINRGDRKELPKDIKEFIEGAEHGVVYFSMGSNIQSAQLPVNLRDGILRSFAKLKQRVLWKWEDTDLPGKPANVFISKWFPQDDILAHPNVKLFITHGGLLSSTEAVYHGVPIIGIPVFGDQFMNMGRAVNVGYGLSINYLDLNEKALSEALEEILSSDKYNQKAKIISSRYRDQPLSPLETAIYWVEYVARHKGASHLHSAGQDLNFIQYHGLDVYAFLTALLFAAIYVVRRILKLIFSKIFGSKSNHRKQKKH